MSAILSLCRKIESKCRNHYYFLYTVIFFISILFVFACYWSNGKSFIWIGGASDGLHQHFKGMLYYGKWLRSIIKELVFTRTLSVPTYSFSIGYGSDILTTLHYYIIGDPLLLLAVLVPTKYMIVFHTATVIARFYLSGITFSMYCLYMGKKANRSLGFGQTALIAGTLVYIFSGFALWGGIKHPYFLNSMIYFPLVLLGVEKILYNKKPIFFIVAVFVSAISNFYFFYMITILTVLYVLWRLFSIYSRKQILKVIQVIVKISLSAILATGMSAVILLPVILAFLNSTRSESRYVHSFLYSIKEYSTYIGGFLSVNQVYSWTLMGYAAIGLIAVILLFIQKDYKDVKVAFIVLTLMTLLPIAGRIMNGFSYVTNRWIWGYSFLIAYIVVLKWRSLFVLTAKEKGSLLAGLGAYFIVCVTLKESSTDSVLFGCSMGFITLGILYLAKEMCKIKYAQFIIIACIIINVAGNAFFKYSIAHSGYTKAYLPYSEVQSKLKNTEATVIGTVSKKYDGFFRYSGTSITRNGTLLSGLHSTQYFWSLENGYIEQFRSEMGLSEQISVYIYKNLDSRSTLSTLANVKYYVQSNNVPYGFEIVNLRKKNTDYRLWNNNYFLPFGYTYTGYIPEDSYKKMTPIEKQEALLQGCVVSDGQGSKAEVFFTGKQINYDINFGKDISVDNNIITVKKNDSILTLTFDGLADAETYLYITGLNYVGQQHADKQHDFLSIYRDNKSLFYSEYYKGPTRLRIPLFAKNTAGENIEKVQTYWTPRYQWYSNRENFMVNFGYDEAAKKSIAIKFPIAGMYVFDSLQVLCQPMNNYSEEVLKLGKNVLQNVNFYDQNPAFATNKITGDITLDTAKYLLLTIPYSKGWTAVVDGKEQSLVRANTMWMALYLKPGKHDILLKYQTPGLKIGAIISMASLILLMLFLYVEKQKSKRSYLH